MIGRYFMRNEIAVSGQLGMAEEKVPVEGSKSDQTIEERTSYTTQQQSMLPDTGELQDVGCIMLIGLLCLIVILIFKTFEKSKQAA